MAVSWRYNEMDAVAKSREKPAHSLSVGTNIYIYIPSGETKLSGANGDRGKNRHFPCLHLTTSRIWQPTIYPVDPYILCCQY